MEMGFYCFSLPHKWILSSDYEKQQLNIKAAKLRFNHLPQKLVLLPKSRQIRNARL